MTLVSLFFQDVCCMHPCSCGVDAAGLGAKSSKVEN